MDQLKKLFPFAFTPKKDTVALLVSIIIHIVIGAVIGFVIGICAKLPIVGVIIGAAGGLVDLYILISIILAVLDYMKVLK